MIDSSGNGLSVQHRYEVFVSVGFHRHCMQLFSVFLSFFRSVCLYQSVSLFPGLSECLALVKSCSSLTDLPPGSSDVKRQVKNHLKSSA